MRSHQSFGLAEARRPWRLTACIGAAAVAIAVVVAACSSDDKQEAINQAVSDHAQILCDRLFSCCTDAELAELAFVDEKSPPTHDGCIAFHQKTAAGFVGVTTEEEAAGRVVINVDVSGECADETRALTCAEFHARLIRIHLGDAFSLCNPAMVEPLVDDGSPCKIYLDCKSGFCDVPEANAKGGDAGAPPAEVMGTCRAAPKAKEKCPGGVCAVGLRCDPATTLCVKLVAQNGDCAADDECASGACRGGKCVSPGRCGG